MDGGNFCQCLFEDGLCFSVLSQLANQTSGREREGSVS